MNTTPKLDPATKEIWAGVRSPAGSQSALGDEINDLRSKLSGIDSYQSFLDQSSVDSFDSYESGLADRATDTLVSEEDVREAREIVEADFADFASFAGDSSSGTGVFGLTNYDEYRAYLTNNGVADVTADVHNRVIQDLFSADDTATEEITDELTSFDELETWLKDNGFSAEDAADFRQKIENEYSSFTDFQTFVDSSESLEAVLDDVDQREQATPGVEYDAEAGVLYLKAPSEIRLQQENVTVGSDDTAADAINFSNVTVSPTVPAPGEQISVAADAQNTASQAVTGGAILRVDGETRSTTTISLPANTTQTVRFRTSLSQIGTYEITIGDASPITVTVAPGGIATTN